MVKDREDNDKLLVCAKQNNVYLWEATDGKVYEFQYLCKYRKLTTNDSLNFKVQIQRENFSILLTTVLMFSTKFLTQKMDFIGSNYPEMFQKRYLHGYILNKRFAIYSYNESISPHFVSAVV